MGGATGSVLTGIGAIFLGTLSWLALNFFGKPILTLREKRREALEVGERYAYVHSRNDDIQLYNLHSKATPNDEQNIAFSELTRVGIALRAHLREHSVSTSLYCWMFGYDLESGARALLNLARAVQNLDYIDPTLRRLILHALFVALSATHHLSVDEIAAARTVMKRWHDGNCDLTTSSSTADNA